MTDQTPNVQHLNRHSTAPTDGSKKFLNMSKSLLAIVVTLILLLCCIGPVALVFMGGVLDAVQPKPTVKMTDCKIDYNGFLDSAKVSYTITNNSETDDNFVVKFVIKDASGIQVGDGSDYISNIAPKATANQEATIFLNAKGGHTCHLVQAD